MLPKVAIVGRPNVGKSSLLNMLANRRVAIVEPTAGVTRDRLAVDVDLPDGPDGEPREVEMIDTGGYGVYAADESLHVLTEEIEHQIGTAIDEAQLILFVIDAQAGLSTLDEQVARLLRQRAANRVPILLVANKADNDALDLEAAEAIRLGFGEPIPTSTTAKRGKWALLEAIAEHIDWSLEPPEPDASEMLLAIVGKRNAGKSTFVNALAGAERVIASELPGTTRDAIDVKFRFDDRRFTAIDTAGVRKRKSLEGDIEYYSMHRTLRSVRRADVVILLIDATTEISQVDKKLAGHVLKHHKPCVIALNKWDLVENRLEPEAYLEYVKEQLRGLDFAPMVFVSAKRDDHVREAVQTALELNKQAEMRVSTGELNQVIREILTQRGPSSKLGTRAKVFFVTQVATHPPTIVLFVNDPDLFSPNYQRYMMNALRDRLPYPEVPIKLVIRRRERRPGRHDEAPVIEA